MPCCPGLILRRECGERVLTQARELRERRKSFLEGLHSVGLAYFEEMLQQADRTHARAYAGHEWAHIDLPNPARPNCSHRLTTAASAAKLLSGTHRVSESAGEKVQQMLSTHAADHFTLESPATGSVLMKADDDPTIKSSITSTNVFNILDARYIRSMSTEPRSSVQMDADLR